MKVSAIPEATNEASHLARAFESDDAVIVDFDCVCRHVASYPTYQIIQNNEMTERTPVEAAQQQQQQANRKALHQELHNAIRTLQSSIMKEEGNEREVAETFKTISRALDQAVERTRKRPEPRTDQEWLSKKTRLAESRRALMELWKLKPESTNIKPICHCIKFRG